MFRKCRLVLKVEVSYLVVQDKIQVKKEKSLFFSFKIRKKINKYIYIYIILTRFTVERRMCVYILIKGNILLLGLNRNILLDKHI